MRTPSPLVSTSRREPDVTPADEISLPAFLATLRYRRDERLLPDELRRREFRKGWNRASHGEPMKDETLRTKLTWNNLGYRAGKAFGPASDAKIHGTFDGFAAIYVRERGTAPPGDGPATPTASEPS